MDHRYNIIVLLYSIIICKVKKKKKIVVEVVLVVSLFSYSNSPFKYIYWNLVAENWKLFACLRFLLEFRNSQKKINFFKKYIFLSNYKINNVHLHIVYTHCANQMTTTATKPSIE